MGDLQEQLHAVDLGHQNQLWEIPFRRQVSPTATLSGRCDFIVGDTIDEAKSTTSADLVRNARYGKPDTGHLAQLVCYLLEFGLRSGRLIYGYFEKSKDGKLVRKDQARVNVELVGEDVHVNGLPTGHKTPELINSILQLDRWLSSDLPAPRPGETGSFFGPCKYCPMAELCKEIDNSDSIAAFKTRAHEAMASQTFRPAKFKKEKTC